MPVQNETIAEGLKVRFAMENKFVAFEVFLPEQYVPGTHVLLPEAQGRLDAIQAAGWKCVAINQRAWERRSLMEHGAHHARRDLVIDLVAAQAPFEARGPPPKVIGIDAIRAKYGSTYRKKRMKGK
jgi:hypothetical protein